MFHVDRWARAFLAANSGAGTAVQDTFVCLKTLSAPIKSAHIIFYGHSDAERIEELLRESIGNPSGAQEYAIRFICLLIEKQCFTHIDLLLEKIEKMLDEQNNILDIIFETAVPADGGFEKDLIQMIKEKTGAAGVKIKTKVNPGLLGGCLIRTDGFYVDASLKGQLENLKTNLFASEVSNVKL